MSTTILFGHGWFDPSYDAQCLAALDASPLSEVLHDLHCEAQGTFGSKGVPIHAEIAKSTWVALAYKISCALDGNLVRKKADECRNGYELIMRYYGHDDIDELIHIHDHLKEHYKYSQRPMPTQNLKKD